MGGDYDLLTDAHTPKEEADSKALTWEGRE